LKIFSIKNENKLSLNLNLKTFTINLETLKLKTHVYHKNISHLESLTNFKDKKLKMYLDLSILYLRGDLKGSIRLVNSIKKNDPLNPYNYILSGDINFQSNKIDNAIFDYKYGIKLINKYHFKAIPKLSLAKALIKKNDKVSIVEALMVLEEIMPYENSTSIFWKLIAKASGKLKLNSKAYIAMAEEQVIKNNLKKAKQFALLGLKDKKLDFTYKIRAEDILNLK
jgi:Putative Zn-dependent protease, contains TPR repeats